tara:strand:- start:1891 stop:2436 length:546 start_codon:yes stop_codon:yes gene_type:complete
MEKLEKQIGDRQDVEILSIMDNKSFGISEKRNELLKLARGSHLAWIDDDDDVADNYVDRLTETIEKNPDVDVISFNQICYLEGIEARVFAKMGNPHEDVVLSNTDPTRYKDTLRPPYHWCVWKTSLAQSEDFKSDVLIPGSDVGEDIDWLNRLYPKVKNSIYLDKDVLHIYRYSREVSESL